MAQVVEFFMWLLLFGSITVSFCSLLLQFIVNDTTDYDMEFLWNYRFTLEELHLDERGD
ncbi:hypothetical protein O9H85_05960 [Paenibacillus filicis]|uniref:Uncharacterized protein n=1 Tax=Paenibacillus gyeongsangnamensis TaxID=3388067 RepID=A0ABT4Q5M4_9BACL|nr:hypothetical protein [Paenibacillus filicis]MCZ8511975.1 hypothetical protein [Paenibacillus filicis]